jgi:hypothetical protein
VLILLPAPQRREQVGQDHKADGGREGVRDQKGAMHPLRVDHIAKDVDLTITVDVAA